MKKIIGVIIKSKKMLLLIAVVVALVVAGIIIATAIKQPSMVTISEASLKEIIEVEELSTLEYTYNSYCPVYRTDKNGNPTDDIKYYVSYKGAVKAGFEFDKLSVTTDQNKKVVSVIIPEINITSVHIDETELDFIFVKEKYNTGETFQEAFKACEIDLKNEAEKNDTLKEYARNNAISAMEALLTPWKETLPEGYTIEIK